MRLVSYLFVCFGIRLTILSAIVSGIFLPPDRDNPHAVADAFLILLAAFVWAGLDEFKYIVLQEDQADKELGQRLEKLEKERK